MKESIESILYEFRRVAKLVRKVILNEYLKSKDCYESIIRYIGVWSVVIALAENIVNTPKRLSKWVKIGSPSRAFS